MASTDALPVPRKNVAYRIYFGIYKNDGTLITGASGLDSEVSKDGAAFADCTNEATEIGSSGTYFLDLTSTEMNTDNAVVVVKTSSTGAVIPTFSINPQELGDIKVDVQSLLGTAWLTPGTAGTPDVNVKLWNALATVALPLVPTTAGRTLDVAATGEAGLDFNNILLSNGAPAAGIDASGTLSGTHSSTTADLGANAPATDITGMTLHFPTHHLSRVVSSYNTGTGVATFASTTETLANSDPWYLSATAPSTGGAGGGDATEAKQDIIIAVLGTPAGASLAADIAAVEAQTDDIGTAGAGLTAIPWNAAWDAEVQSEVTDALNAYDPPTRAEATSDANSILTAVADVPTNAELATALAAADDAVLSAVAAVSAKVDAVDDLIDTEVAAIKTVVDAILVDTGTTLDGKIDTIDTVVDAIKTNTDKFANLPTVTSSGTGGQGFGAP